MQCLFPIFHGNNSYGVMGKRREKEVQNIIIQAVDCNQLSVLPSISTVGPWPMIHWGKRKTEREKVVLERQSQTILQVGCSIWASNPKWWWLCPRIGSNRGARPWESIVSIWCQWTSNPHNRKNWRVQATKIKRGIHKIYIRPTLSDRMHVSHGGELGLFQSQLLVLIVVALFWQVFGRRELWTKVSMIRPSTTLSSVFNCKLGERGKKAGRENVSTVLQYNVHTLLS